MWNPLVAIIHHYFGPRGYHWAEKESDGTVVARADCGFHKVFLSMCHGESALQLQVRETRFLAWEESIAEHSNNRTQTLGMTD